MSIWPDVAYATSSRAGDLAYLDPDEAPDRRQQGVCVGLACRGGPRWGAASIEKRRQGQWECLWEGRQIGKSVPSVPVPDLPMFRWWWNHELAGSRLSGVAKLAAARMGWSSRCLDNKGDEGRRLFGDVSEKSEEREGTP
ncbi:hypothetical protein BJV74DRAFT_799355 [Russula compacta]|nr:hypothetical protein BJV74DRAFT_799355 [Russula compacta]